MMEEDEKGSDREGERERKQGRKIERHTGKQQTVKRVLHAWGGMPRVHSISGILSLLSLSLSFLPWSNKCLAFLNPGGSERPN